MSIKYMNPLRSALKDIDDFVVSKLPIFLEALGEDALHGLDTAPLRGAHEELEALRAALDRIDRRLDMLYSRRKP